MKKPLLIVAFLSVFAGTMSAQGLHQSYVLPDNAEETSLPELRTLPSVSPDGFAHPTKFVLNTELKPTTVKRLSKHVYEYKNLESYSLLSQSESSYSYDQYGFRSFESTSFLHQSYPSTSSYEYTWLDPGMIWDTKTINNQIETRTFYDNNYVKTAHTHPKGNPTDTISYYAYDPEGNLTEGVRFYYGGVREIYLAPKKQWTVPRDNEEYFVAENNCLITKIYTSAEKTQLQYVKYEWYAKNKDYPRTICTYTEYYTDGVLTNTTSVKLEFTEDMIVVEGYSKIECSLDWYNDRIYAPGKSYWFKNYAKDEVNGETVWRIYNSTTETWIAPGVLKREYTDFNNLNLISQGYVNYCIYENGQQTGNYAGYDEATGSYVLSSSDPETSPEARIGIPGYYGSGIYTYYDKDGRETERLKIHDRDYWSKWNGSEWVPCTGSLTHNLWPTVMEITFDNQNRVKTITRNDGSQSEYTYISGGYIKEVYIGEKLLNKYTETFIDNIRTTESRYYATDTPQGTKTVYNFNTHIITYYNLVESEWVKANNQSLQHLEILEGGDKYLRINYQISGNNGVSNSSKVISNMPNNNGFTYREIYFWDSYSGTWIGQEKYSQQIDLTSACEFAYAEPLDPSIYDDEYFVPAKTIYYTNSEAGTYYNSVDKRWYWDNENKTWILAQDRADKYELTAITNGKQLQHTVTDYSESGEVLGTQTSTYKVNNAGLLCLYEDNNTKREFTYDTDNRLLQKSEVKGNYSNTDVYRYTEIEILSGVENVSATVAQGVTIDGRTVIAPAASDAEVYNLQGAHVATIAAGSSATLPAGLYIIATSATSTKALIK